MYEYIRIFVVGGIYSGYSQTLILLSNQVDKFSNDIVSSYQQFSYDLFFYVGPIEKIRIRNINNC